MHYRSKEVCDTVTLNKRLVTPKKTVNETAIPPPSPDTIMEVCQPSSSINISPFPTYQAENISSAGKKNHYIKL